jgi:hypothetical protein
MVAKLSPTELDEILALQLTVAWAGESAGEPKRLGCSRDDFESMIAGLGKPKIQVTPSGRQLETTVKSPVELARQLAAALLPLTAEYPLPYAEVSA